MTRKTVGGKACRCPDTTPESCVQDDEVLTQWAIVNPNDTEDPTFSRQPRPNDYDSAVSLVRGRHEPDEAFKQSVGKYPDTKNRSVVARYTSAREVRGAGLAVVHTPGRISGSLHVSVVHPPEDPLMLQQADWPADTQNRFDNCFTNER